MMVLILSDLSYWLDCHCWTGLLERERRRAGEEQACWVTSSLLSARAVSPNGSRCQAGAMSTQSWSFQPCWLPYIFRFYHSPLCDYVENSVQRVVVDTEGPLCSGCSCRFSCCSPVGAGVGECCHGGKDTASLSLHLGAAPAAAAVGCEQGFSLHVVARCTLYLGLFYFF